MKAKYLGTSFDRRASGSHAEVDVAMNRQQRRGARKQARQPQAVASARPSADQAYAEAGRLVQAGRVAEAQKLCQAALAADSNHPYSLLLNGILLLRAGRREEGGEALIRAAAQGQQAPDFHNNLGNALVEIGRLALAKDQFERALRGSPDNIQLLYNLANINVAIGEAGPAVAAFEKALAVAPDFFDARLNLGNLFAQIGRTADAIREFEAAIALKPDSAEAHNNLGFVLNETNRPAEAVAHIEQAIALKPAYAHAHNNLGNAYHALGATEPAIACYRKALALDPNYVNALSNLGNALSAVGRYDEALAAVDRAVALDPKSAPVRNGRGNLLQKVGRLAEAIAEYERAIGLQPNYDEAWTNLAAVRNDTGHHDKAILCCDRAITINPRRAGAHSNRGVALVALQRFDEAMESYQRALALEPQLGDLHCNIGSALVEQGRMDEALTYFEQAIAAEPRRPKFHLCHVLTKRVAEGDPRLAALETLARETKGMPPEDLVDLRFALAKAYGDVGRDNDAFIQLLAGNALKRKSMPYDEAMTFANLDHFSRTWTREAVAAWSGMGNPSETPIFIVGMPRSGSTLVEQILASHPAVAARGELSVFYDAACATLGPLERFLPARDDVPNRAGALDRIAARYLAALGPTPPGVVRLIDKTPGNFAFVPYLRAALPNARIIHTRRDPLDTCLSCFASLFTSVAFAYDLSELGRYWRAYERVMRHWREVLPEDAILDVDYEALVGDFETQARRILDYCGLPWDERCLAFHTTARPVKTASAVQVRQPLYSSSVGRAKRLDPALIEPLRAALEG